MIQSITITISISKYNPLAGSSYIKLPKYLDHPTKDLIYIQNTDDNECFKWCLARFLDPADIIQEELKKLIKIFQRDFILKT